MLCWSLLLSLLVGLSFAEQGLMLEGDVTITGEVYEVFSTADGAFVLTLMTNDKYYLRWGSKDGTKNVQCTFDKTILPLNVLFLDSYVDASTLYILNSVSSQVFLHSFWITNSSSTCNTLTQLAHTPKGKILYGFLLPRGQDLLVSVVDSKREWYYALLPPSNPTTVVPPTWTQTRSLIEVDTAAGDTTGSTSNKAIPVHYYLSRDNLIAFLDKTGKVYTTDIIILNSNNPTNKFVSLIYAPKENVTYIRSFYADNDLGLAAIAQVEPACASNLLVFKYSQAISVGQPTQTLFYSGMDDGLKCEAVRAISDGTSIFYQNGQSLLKLTSGTPYTSAVFFTNQTATSAIQDFQAVTTNSLMIVTREALGTVIYRSTGTATPEKFNGGATPFAWSNILRWDIVKNGATIKGSLWYSKIGVVYGSGFDDTDTTRISVAREADRDYIDVNMAAISPSLGDTASVTMGFNDGDVTNLEVIRVVKWDYSSLTLPLDGGAPPPEGGGFKFEDFITSLTRVKNEAKAAFTKTEIKYVSAWTPADWHKDTGLQLDISFNDGVKLVKAEQVLNTIANELEVIIERECEYRDYLVCDSFNILMTYTVTSDGTASRKRVIEEKVVFQVVASAGLFVPSLILSVLVVLLGLI